MLARWEALDGPTYSKPTYALILVQAMDSNLGTCYYARWSKFLRVYPGGWWGMGCAMGVGWGWFGCTIEYLNTKPECVPGKTSWVYPSRTYSGYIQWMGEVYGAEVGRGRCDGVWDRLGLGTGLVPEGIVRGGGYLLKATIVKMNEWTNKLKQNNNKNKTYKQTKSPRQVIDFI